MQTQSLVGATIYPEDGGTNTDIDREDPARDNPDTDDAANLAQAFRIVGASDAILWGVHVTYNSSESSADVSSGAAAVASDSARAKYAGVTRYDVAYAVRLPASSDLPITAGSVNHVWLHLPQTGNDEAEYAVSVGDESPPTEPRLKIAEIDPSASTPVTELNRGSEVAARSLVGDILGSDDATPLQSLTDGDLSINSQGSLVLSGTSDAVSDADTLGGNGPSYYASVEEQEVITPEWTFETPINGDLNGSASQLGGDAASKFPRRDTGENITGNWTIDNNRILTTGDEGSLNAGSLGGRSPSQYAIRSENELITGAWRFNTPFSLTDSTSIRFGSDYDLTAGFSDGTFDLTANGESSPSLRIDPAQSTPPVQHPYGTHVHDDQSVTFGTDEDFEVQYDASANELHISDSSNTASPQVIVPTNADGPPRFPNGMSVGGSQLPEVVADGSTTLTDGYATIGTGITEQATFNVNLAADISETSDVKLVGRYFWDSSAGEHVVEIIESGTDMGNPTVHYVIERTT